MAEDIYVSIEDIARVTKRFNHMYDACDRNGYMVPSKKS